MADVHDGKTPDEIKAEWLEILDGDDPDEFQTPKSLNDGNVSGDAFAYKQGLHAALKGEADSPFVRTSSFHEGWRRMVWAMHERGITPLPPGAERPLAVERPHHFAAANPARLDDSGAIPPRND